jgi:pyruvate kinase
MSSVKVVTRSKIVCTLGPASDTAEKIRDLVDRGMDVARINFSHGTIEEKTSVFNAVREVDPTVAIMCDIQGPKIRIGQVQEGGATLVANQDITVTTEEVLGTAEKITISYPELPEEIKPGELIFINDGLICLQAVSVEAPEIMCKVLVGGVITSKKGVNLPRTEISLRVPTEKDTEDLKFIADLDPEFVSVSFVRDETDIQHVRDVLAENGNDRIKLIAKIERPMALDNFEAILKASDSIMVARGDLGVEIPFETLIPAQKMMVKRCNVVGKPVIVATQMLESMTESPVPTRAEVSDVFNAVADGADAVMLSAETAMGKYPNNAVETMERIIRVAEANIPLRNPDEYDSDEENVSEIIGHLVHNACKEFADIYCPNSSAAVTAEKLQEVKILALTDTGLTPRLVSKYRPPVTILSLTHDQRISRELRLVWGVEPLIIPEIENTEHMFKKIQKFTQTALADGLLNQNDKLIVAGNLDYSPVKTNMVAIFTVQDILNSMG